MSSSKTTTNDAIIDYFPNFERHLERSKKIRAANENDGRMTLPEGFPSQIQSRMTWAGEMLKTDEWLLHLTPVHLSEIEGALRHFENLKLPFGLIAPETFPLSTLGPFIRDTVADQIYNGRGFAVLRSMPVDKYDEVQNAIIYAGLCAWLGRLRGRQDPNSDIVLRHIKDLSSHGVIGTAQYTADSQPYHTDWGDVVALYCTSTPARGGASHLASMEKVYNELTSTRPDIIRVLSEKWAFDNFGAQPPYIERPLIFFHAGHLFLQYSRRLFTGYQTYQRSDACPTLTEEQADAMEELEFIAQKFAVTFQLEKGDIQWLNNMALLHGRDAYADDEDNVRELLRIWVRNEDLAWDMPPALLPHWRQLFYTAKPEAQVFFPEVSSGQNEAKQSQEGKAWVYAGNEGGIPESEEQNDGWNEEDTISVN